MAEQSQQQAPTPLKHKKTIYDAGYGSIFARNFLAGFARALGTLMVYLFLGGVMYYLAATYLLPQIQNLLPSSFPLFGPTIQQTPGFTGEPAGYTITPEKLEGVSELFQQNQGLDPPEPQQSP